MPRERVIQLDVAGPIDVGYLFDLMEEGAAVNDCADSDYANFLRELLDGAINWFDLIERDVDPLTDEGGPRSKVEKIKKECNKGRAGVRFLKSKVQPNAVKTSLLVDYRQELRHILRRHTTIIAALSRRIKESHGADVESHCHYVNMALVWARSKTASDATMLTAPSGDHITEMMREAPRGGVQGFTAVEFEEAQKRLENHGGIEPIKE